MLNFTYDTTATTLLSSGYRCNFGDKKSSRVSDCLYQLLPKSPEVRSEHSLTKDLIYSLFCVNARVFGKLCYLLIRRRGQRSSQRFSAIRRSNTGNRSGSTYLGIGRATNPSTSSRP